jgi:NCAIR mutase (PurE)-related protein
MNPTDLRGLLDRVRDGSVGAGAAADRILEALRAAPYEDLGFARVDHHREIRQGFPEVILGVGKTPAQIATIAARIVARGRPLLITRVEPDAFDAVRAAVPRAKYHVEARDETPG